MKFTSGLLMLLCITFFAFDASAQKVQKKNRKQKVTEKQEVQQQSNSYRYVPENQSEGKSQKKNIKRNKKSFAAIFDKQLENKREEFYERLEANAKRDKKIKRKMEHPMYSDFSYFGHKKPPKKRPVGKRKFCKECGIVH